jgi:hypothetical protein
MWVAVGEGTNSIAYSSDGTFWTGVAGSTSLFNNYGAGVAWCGSLWVAVGSGSFQIATSPDGINWTGLSSSVLSANGNRVAWNSGKGSVKINGGGGTLSLNAYGPGLSNKLDVVSSKYYNKGFNNFSVHLKTIN